MKNDNIKNFRNIQTLNVNKNGTDKKIIEIPSQIKPKEDLYKNVQLSKIKNSKYVPKLIIPKEVSDKILCINSIVSNIEWSGVLFYEISGSIDKDLVLNIKDVLLLDIGNAAYTNYEITAEVPGYMVENGLTMYRLGHIHSHHNMESFFSSTDLDTLKKEAMDNIHFLSLIVNNKGEYTASITSRKSLKINTVTTSSGYTYDFSGNKQIEPIKNIETKTLDIVEYVECEIIIENSLLKDLLERCDIIKKNKISSQRYTDFSNTNQDFPYLTGNFVRTYENDFTPTTSKNVSTSYTNAYLNSPAKIEELISSFEKTYGNFTLEYNVPNAIVNEFIKRSLNILLQEYSVIIDILNDSAAVLQLAFKKKKNLALLDINIENSLEMLDNYILECLSKRKIKSELLKINLSNTDSKMSLREELNILVLEIYLQLSIDFEIINVFDFVLLDAFKKIW